MKPAFRYSIYSSFIAVFLSVFWLTNFTPLTSQANPIIPTQAAAQAKAGSLPAALSEADPAPAAQVGVGLPRTASNNIYRQKNKLPEIMDEVWGVPDTAAAGAAAAEQLVEAAEDFPHSDSLHSYIEQVSSAGSSAALLGVFVEDVLALPVVQQPDGNFMFVSEVLETVTQFQSAADNGVTGLLAHNYLSGDLFFNLALGQEVNLVYGDEQVSRYLITRIESYEKLPGSLYDSSYRNLETQEVVTTPDLFASMYTGGDKVTLQTCIKRGSDWSWGRIFITATPLP